ncbi:MAG: arylesterase [Acidobacteria bacterium]|nr:arylesterase [Acidobacteriota bacterium]
MLMTLFACSTAKAPKPAPAEAPPDFKPMLADPRPVIVTFGNSLSAGFGVDPGLSFPDFLQKELDRAGFRYRLVNEGVSGDTTSGGAARIASVLAHNPEIVILELGANDGLRGIPVGTTRDNLDQMIRALEKSGAKVLLAGITLPRNYGPDYIRQFDHVYPELAARHKVPLLPFLLEGVALNPKLMQRDALHPNTEGNKIVAASVFKALQPLLRRE